MKKEVSKLLIDNSQFDLYQTLSCGQVFSYIENGDNSFYILSANKIAKVTQKKQLEIISNDLEYFRNYFDLQTDYNKIFEQLLKFPELQNALIFGNGIRILKQDLLEVIISFVISANNNIGRIKKSLFFIREHLGKKFLFDNKTFYAFPTLEKLAKQNEDFFIEAGLGYRAKQMVKLILQLKSINLQDYAKLPTEELKLKLVALSGIGNKVADCILLFGYSRSTFPVDTWNEKVFNKIFGNKNISRLQMSKIFIERYGDLAGYAQQYLFNEIRNG